MEESDESVFVRGRQRLFPISFLKSAKHLYLKFEVIFAHEFYHYIQGIPYLNRGAFPALLHFSVYGPYRRYTGTAEVEKAYR